MKKALVILFCCLANISYADIKGNGIYFDVNEDFVTAFENCTPYTTKGINPEDMPKKDMPEEYNSIEVKGMHKDLCVFNLIMQMSSKRSYFKTVKRCKISSEQKIALLKSIKNIRKDKGREYIKETGNIIDQCSVVENKAIYY